MTDLHTHILPAMDDGARDAAQSLAMLSAERAQGVDTVVLTPHFRRSREEADSFLRRRAESYDTLRRAAEQSDKSYPHMLLGAEVEWVPNLTDCDLLPQLCLGESRYLLLELPFYAWSDSMIEQLYHLMQKTGIVPILAHIERYLYSQKRELLREIFRLGVPIQMNAEMLLRWQSKNRALSLLRKGEAQLIASDCHNTTSRPPNLAKALELLLRERDIDTSDYGDDYICSDK